MFDVSWSELLIVGVVALLVVGPKEMPTLLRTVGKYLGIIRRQAAEFRAQFDEAMREAELDQLRKEVETVKSETESALHDAHTSVTREVDDARRVLDDAGRAVDDPSDDAARPAEPRPEQAPDPADTPRASTAEAGVNGHSAPPPTDPSPQTSRPDPVPGEPKAPA